MQIFRSADSPFRPVDSKSFVGTARAQRLAQADAGVPVVVYRVEFGAGARTNWHVHSGAQWLMVVDGSIRIQRWGEPPREIRTGDAVVIAPGEKHWHGATPGLRGVHLAVNVSATTQWMEPVSDEQYNDRR